MYINMESQPLRAKYMIQSYAFPLYHSLSDQKLWETIHDLDFESIMKLHGTLDTKPNKCTHCKDLE